MRHLPGDKESAKKFFNKLSKGYISEETISKGKGMPNGDTLTYRPVSSSDGSPAVEINSKPFGYQKIHFIK